MATFKCPVVKVEEVFAHPNADTLEIARVLGYQCIVRSGYVSKGDLVVFIPEGSIVPEWLLKEIGLWSANTGKGRLAGRQGNRVVPANLRGEISEGLLYPLSWKADENTGVIWALKTPDVVMTGVKEGDDVKDLLGVTKWVPDVPIYFSGKLEHCRHVLTYDIENVKAHYEAIKFLIDNEIRVSVTEKIHGTLCEIGVLPVLDDDLIDSRVVVTSKGFAKNRLAFSSIEENLDNVYVQAYLKYREDFLKYEGPPVYYLMEIFGKKIQDLNYGLPDRRERLFDVYIGAPGKGRFVSREELDNGKVYVPNDLELVPELYNGPLTWELLEELTDGPCFTGAHMREGIVIKPYETDFISFPKLGRLILKSVSEKYLTRKNKKRTEYR